MAIGGIASSQRKGQNISGLRHRGSDVRAHLGKKRVQDLLRKKEILKPTPKTPRAGGEIDAIRAVIAQGEGFTMPVNFVVEFSPPSGLKHEFINPGGLDAQSHILNRNDDVRERGILWSQASEQGNSTWKRRAPPPPPSVDDPSNIETTTKKSLKKIDIYCSKVAIPDRTIAQGLYRHYGSTFAYPNSAMTYGTLTTTFYCDATMSIKKFFDAWQNLIYNPITGNFNYYNEYTSKFDVFSTSSIAASGKAGMASAKGSGLNGWAKKLQEGLQNTAGKIDEFFGSNKSTEGRAKIQGEIPSIEFNRTYGCRIYECWPQVVGGVEFSHDGGGSVATFDVTWAYHKWSPFQMEGVSNRTDIRLAVGEMRNEKDGIPFLEDLPPELAGPIGGAVQQAFNTSPLSKGSNLFG